MNTRRRLVLLRIMASLPLVPAVLVTAVNRGNALLLSSDGCGQILDVARFARLRNLAEMELGLCVVVLALVWAPRTQLVSHGLLVLLLSALAVSAYWAALTWNNLEFLYACDVFVLGSRKVFALNALLLFLITSMFALNLLAICGDRTSLTRGDG